MSAHVASGAAWATHPWVTEGHGAIRFGAGVSTRAPLPDWPTRVALVRGLEALGFDSHWVPDHPAFTLDCWAVLAALAGATERIRLGPLVSCAGYRPPVLQARLAADADRLSGGRIILGLGWGSFAGELALLGLPMPTIAERQQQLRETIEIVYGLWGTAPGASGPPDASFVAPWLSQPGPPPLTYHGVHHQLEGVILRPGPVQVPRVPVLIAGGGERVTLRHVARYADAANFGMDGTPNAARTLDGVRHKVQSLRRHCDELGRPFASVLMTHFTNPVMLAATDSALAARRAALPAAYQNVEGLFGTPDDAIAFYRPLVEAGLRYFIVNLTTYDDLETPRLLDERVFPALQG